MNKFSLILISLCFSFAVFADAAKQAELEARIKRIEDRLGMGQPSKNNGKSGLKTVDYGNSKVSNREAFQ